jgi:hypothetical protein
MFGLLAIGTFGIFGNASLLSQFPAWRPTSLFPQTTPQKGRNLNLEESGQSSVDAFLERRFDLREVGKAAIAAMLVPCEGKRLLYGDWIEKRKHARSLGDSGFEDSWYDLLFAMLTEGAPKWQDLEDNQP